MISGFHENLSMSPFLGMASIDCLHAACARMHLSADLQHALETCLWGTSGLVLMLVLLYSDIYSQIFLIHRVPRSKLN